MLNNKPTDASENPSQTQRSTESSSANPSPFFAPLTAQETLKRLENAQKTLQTCEEKGFKKAINFLAPQEVLELIAKNKLQYPHDDFSKALHPNNFSSFRLLSKDNALYFLGYGRILVSQNACDPKLLPDGVYSFVVVLKNIDGKPQLELRTIPMKSGVHNGLTNDDQCVLAGELYIQDHQILLVNDKTGGLIDSILKLGLNSKDLADTIFKPYYHKIGGFYYWAQRAKANGEESADYSKAMDEALANELARRKSRIVLPEIKMPSPSK